MFVPSPSSCLILKRILKWRGASVPREDGCCVQWELTAFSLSAFLQRLTQHTCYFIIYSRDCTAALLLSSCSFIKIFSSRHEVLWRRLGSFGLVSFLWGFWFGLVWSVFPLFVLLHCPIFQSHCYLQCCIFPFFIFTLDFRFSFHILFHRYMNVERVTPSVLFQCFWMFLSSLSLYVYTYKALFMQLSTRKTFSCTHC